MDTAYEAILLEELNSSGCGSRTKLALKTGHRVHVVGVLSDFPLFKRFGILELDGQRLMVDFDLVDFNFRLLECNLYHVLGELQDLGEQVSGSPPLAAAAEKCALSCLYLKVRFVRAAGGLDVKLYKLSILARRKFLEERKKEA
jgi:hypothetical protein